MSMKVNASVALAQLNAYWDMPTLAREQPEVIQWLEDRILIDSDMLFQVVVVDKRTGVPVVGWRTMAG